jgi:2-oxoglutarate dehydrogenase E2 component (dihydrolipoamide succinyltransferase)
MATDVVIPQLGESIAEAVIATWLKADGDYVERDEEIVELETDKVTMPLPSPIAGVLKHTAEEGDTIEVGAVVATVDESADAPAGGKAKANGASQPAAAEAAAPTPPPPSPPRPGPRRNRHRDRHRRAPRAAGVRRRRRAPRHPARPQARR